MSVHTKKSDTVPERYAHIKNPNHPLATNATVFARMEPGSKVWIATVAFCSSHDQFSRTTGRSVARRRYFNDEKARLVLGEEFTYEAAVKLADEVAASTQR